MLIPTFLITFQEEISIPVRPLKPGNKLPSLLDPTGTAATPAPNSPMAPAIVVPAVAARPSSASARERVYFSSVFT